MTNNIEFTGERFVPGLAGEIAHEHWHRYAFASPLVARRRVLDMACGEGYGSAILARQAASVLGVDLAQQAVDHAGSAYATVPNLKFEVGSATALPLADSSIDVAVSFETIEHLPQADQARMLAELDRVLAPGGFVILSAPNPVEYSQARNYRNPFHLHEPSRIELAAMLAVSFPQVRWYRQRRFFGSALWSEAGGEEPEVWAGDGTTVGPAEAPAAMYYVVIAARAESDLPAAIPSLSLFSDSNEGELARIDAQASEVLRLDGLLHERDTSLDRQTAHVRHLEELAGFRERLVVERDGQLEAANALREAMETRHGEALRAAHEDGMAQAGKGHAVERAETDRAMTALRTECGRLERAIAAQERIIVYRQSARWWLALPFLRLRLWWQRARDE